MKFLIASWGNPKNWKEVIYKFMGRSLKSKTSLKVLQEVLNPDETIILVLDTLAEEGRNYKEVKENVKSKMESYIDEFEIFDPEIIISPGIGIFEEGSFFGSALDYYYYSLYEISKKFLESLESGDEDIKIFLDLTHGLNYTVILTYRMIKELAGILSIFKNVEFSAYNADPSPQRFAKELSINIIEESIVVPSIPNEKIVGSKKALEPINLTPEEREAINKELREIEGFDKSSLSAFLGALHNGLPLALLTFYPKVNRLKGVIENILEIYERYIEVYRNEKLKVSKKLRIGRNFKGYVISFFISSLMKDSDIITSQKKEVDVKEIEELADKLFKFDERLKIRIKNYVYTIKNLLKNKEVESWCICNKVLGRNVGEPDKRNFLAHSGLEKNIIEVKKRKDSLLIRYRDDKISTIKNLCQSGLI